MKQELNQQYPVYTAIYFCFDNVNYTDPNNGQRPLLKHPKTFNILCKINIQLSYEVRHSILFNLYLSFPFAAFSLVIM